MIGRIACVVFDIDDTLYLERDYVLSGFRAVGRWLEESWGISGFEVVAKEEYRAGTRGKIFDRAFERLNVPHVSGLVAEAVTRYRRHRPGITLLEDAFAALESLCGCVQLAAVSDGPLESQEAKVRALALDRWLQPIVLTARLGEAFGKPHRRAFEVVEDACGFRGEACAYVADNPEKDFAGPKELGWQSVRIRRHGGEHSREPSGADVDIELTDLRLFTRVLEGMR